MFKYTILATALLSSSVISASAETLFRGTLQVTAASVGCTKGPEAGDISNGQFHPAAVPGNFNFSAVNVIERFNAQSLRLLAAGSFTSSFQQVSNVAIGWSDFTPDKPGFVLVSKQTPATLAATTPNVTLVGKIKNPFGITGQENCIANFLFVGVKVTQ